MSPRKALAKPLRLDDGRLLLTLEDAARLILTLPLKEQANPKWERAAGMLQTAIATGREDHVILAAAQIERALTWPPFGSVRIAERQDMRKPPAPSIARASRRGRRAVR